LLTPLLQAALHGIEHDIPDGQRTVIVVRAFDDDPRRLGGIGHAQHMAGNLLQLAISLEPLIAGLGDPPGGARVALEGLQALLLPVLGKMKPELQDQGTFIDQHRLEAVDFVEAIFHLGAPHVTDDTIGDRLRIPGAGKDPIFPCGGKARQ